MNDKSVSLFRKEAVQAAKSRFGSPVRLSGVSNWVMTFFFCALFFTGLVFICFTNYTRKETVQGQVTATDGALRIVATKSAVADQVLVEEGQVVEAGQELISLNSNQRLKYGDSVADKLQENTQEQFAAHHQQLAARKEQLRSQKDELLVRHTGLEQDLKQLASTRELQQQRVAMQEQTVQTLRKLGEQGHIAALTVRAKEEELIATRQNLVNLERERERQQNQAKQIDAQLARLKSDESLLTSDARNSFSQLAEKKLSTEASYSDHLVAPTRGIVTALQVKKGSSVSPNQVLAIVLPLKNTQSKGDQGLEVELWAPSRSIGFVKPGGKVRLMFDSFPYQSFGVGTGVVRDVSQAPTMPSDIPSALQAREQLFRIRVTLNETSLAAYGRAWQLTPGMGLTADMVLEERSLLDWLLDPILAAKKRAG